jgi:hypothetical protein
MSAAQRGTAVAGTWVIALGVVLLVQQALDVPWNEAWPLFLVMAGVGTGVSALIGLAGRRVSAWVVVWALLWPIVLAAVGILLFVDFAGLAEIDAMDFLAQWWPVALIVLGVVVLVGGVWPRGRGIEETISIPVASGTGSGEVVVKFGAGTLEVGRGSPGVLVEGTLEGGARRRELGANRVELESDVMQIVPAFGQTQRWRLGLAPDLPIRLRLEGGASRSTLDLTDLGVTDVIVKTGASDTRVVLPRAVERCTVRIEAGAAQVTIEVPEGVAASIRSTMGLGTTNVAEGRFPRSGDGRWRSPDFDAAPYRAEIEISGGVGTAHIR